MLSESDRFRAWIATTLPSTIAAVFEIASNAPTCRERAMVFLKRSYIIGAVLVYQFPRQGTPYETREL